MGYFSKYPKLSKIPPDFRLVRVEETFEFHTSDRDTIEVLEGFTSDGASIPKVAWSIIGGPYGEYLYGAIVHDWCYFLGLFSRKRCDQIFLEAMEDLRVAWLKRKIMYWAVRAFGWIGWNVHRKRQA